MQLCGWKTGAMFRRYAIVDERDLRSAVELLARGTRGAIEGDTQAEGGMMRGLGPYSVQCPGRDSNPDGVAPKGF